jgi:hypothetical protein
MPTMDVTMETTAGGWGNVWEKILKWAIFIWKGLDIIVVASFVSLFVCE